MAIASVMEQMQKLFSYEEILQKLDRRNREFEQFRRILLQLLRHLAEPGWSLARTHAWLLEKFSRDVGAAAGLILGVDGKATTVKAVTGALASHDAPEIIEMLGEPLIRAICQRKKPLILDNPTANQQFADCRPGFANLLAVPVFFKSTGSRETAAAVVILGDKPGGFSSADIEKVGILFEVVSEQIRFAELKNRSIQKEALSPLIGTSAALDEVREHIYKVANSDATVLIEGESGTGKDLVAERIHHASDRRDFPFVKVNCAAITESLMESQFFGHVRGAFSGAVKNHTGFFEAAHNGTILLDEITETSPDFQKILLRVLDTKEITRVGETKPRKFNFRVIAATNREVEHEVRRGNFREDLFFRLDVFRIKIAPLRERPDDILAITTHFLHKLGGEHYALLPDAKKLLMQYRWPGNVREVISFVQKLVVTFPDLQEVTARHVQKLLPKAGAPPEENHAVSIAGAMEDGFELRRMLHHSLAHKNLDDDCVNKISDHLRKKGVITRRQLMQMMDWPQKRNFEARAERILSALDKAGILKLDGKKHVYQKT